MRFEAKHQQLKKIPKTTKNFKNLPKTSSERHQSGVRADAIPLTSDPSAWADEHRSSKKNIVANGSTYTKVLDENERAMVEQSILRWFPSKRT